MVIEEPPLAPIAARSWCEPGGFVPEMVRATYAFDVDGPS